MHDLKIFENNEFGNVRVVMQNGEPWFVAKDVCECLDIGRQQDSTRYIDDDEKGECLVNTPSGEQVMVIVSEPGMYSLILRSRKPEAKAFKRWITHEVIPSIRKHGVYATQDFLEKSIADPEWAIGMLQSLKFEREQRQLAERQRDEAIRTKSWISDKKTATAMNTASRLSKENAHLKDEIGKGKNWKTVRAIPWLKKYFDLKKGKGLYTAIGFKLSDISKDMGIERKKVDRSEFTVYRYHILVIDELKRRMDNDYTILSKWRKHVCKCGSLL